MTRHLTAARSLGTLAGLACLAACVPPPPAHPTIAAYPPQGKDYSQFRNDDGYCQQEASRATDGVNPGAAATQNGVASAAIGTGLGAAAGALIGAASGHAGVGAAIGAGGGLLAGSAVGAGNAQATGESIQGQYNMVYAQCMVAHGNQVQGFRRRPRLYGGYGDQGPPPDQGGGYQGGGYQGGGYQGGGYQGGGYQGGGYQGGGYQGGYSPGPGDEPPEAPPGY